MPSGCKSLVKTEAVRLYRLAPLIRPRSLLSKDSLLAGAMLAAVVGLVWPGIAWAGMLTVDGTRCNLVDAISAANRDAPEGGCPAGSGQDTLLLTAAVYTLTQVNNWVNDPCPYPRCGPGGYQTPNGLPMVISAINLNGDPDGDGNGAVVERSKAANTPPFRLLHVEPTGKLVARRVTFRNGGGGTLCGGGIRIRYLGTLSLIGSTVSDNRVDEWYGSGGGICIEGGVVSLHGSVITGNQGSGILNRGGSLSLWGSTVSDNGGDIPQAPSDGGLDNYAGTVSLVNSTVTGNRGYSFGGVRNLGAATVINSTISGNLGEGFVNYGTATLSHVTVNGNGPPLVPAGGVSSFGLGTLRLINSIVANNVGGDCGVFVDYSGRLGSIDLSGVNLIEDGSCEAAAKGSRIGDPDLGPLADNGAATKTNALLSCSGAIDAADDAFCPTTDQREMERPQGLHCDIGAFELVAPNRNVCLVNFRSSWKRVVAP